ncbi:MAG: enoyl-CoA hydratase family protein [Actinomycetes bacterium]
MSDELVHLTADDHVATITLDSPHNRNALSRQLMDELGARLAGVGADDTVHVVVLDATGSTFCAGADLSEAATGSMTEGARRLMALLRTVVELPKPVVARVQGHVRAGGIGLVAACDVVVAAEESTFAFPEVRLGLTPAVISVIVLPRISQRAAALHLLGGEPFGGQEAARAGLVTVVAPRSSMDDAVASVVHALRSGSPQGLAETKRLLTADLLRRFDDLGEEMAELSGRLFGSDVAQERMRAFLERRPPQNT